MRLRACIFILSFFSLTHAYSQSHFSAGLNVGAAIPVGAFGKKIISSHEGAGHAQTGISLDVHAAYRIGRTLGIIVTAGGQENKKSVKGLKEEFGLDSAPGHVTADTKNWRMGKLMGGGTIRIPVADSGRVVLTAAAEAGMCKTHVPGYSFVYTYSDGTNTVIQENKYDGRNLHWAFCYNIRTGVSFRLSKRIYLNGSLSYFDAKPEETLYYPGSGNFINSYKSTHRLSTLSAEAGIEILL